MARLSGNVAVRHPDGGEIRVFGPKDTVPEWAARQITNESAWSDGKAPYSDESPPGPTPDDLADVTRERDAALAELAAFKAGSGPSGVPPKGGPGSGKDAWVAYAAEHDVEVPADATREDIVAALDAADVPTE